MIAAVLIIAYIGFYSLLIWVFVAGFFADSISNHTITCHCGQCRVRKVVIVDPSDFQRLSDILSEDCPTCRTLKAIGYEPSAISRQPVGRALPADQYRDRKGAASESTIRNREGTSPC